MDAFLNRFVNIYTTNKGFLLYNRKSDEYVVINQDLMNIINDISNYKSFDENIQKTISFLIDQSILDNQSSKDFDNTFVNNIVERQSIAASLLELSDEIYFDHLLDISQSKLSTLFITVSQRVTDEIVNQAAWISPHFYDTKIVLDSADLIESSTDRIEKLFTYTTEIVLENANRLTDNELDSLIEILFEIKGGHAHFCIEIYLDSEFSEICKLILLAMTNDNRVLFKYKDIKKALGNFIRLLDEFKDSSIFEYEFIDELLSWPRTNDYKINHVSAEAENNQFDCDSCAAVNDCDNQHDFAECSMMQQIVLNQMTSGDETIEQYINSLKEIFNHV